MLHVNTKSSEATEGLISILYDRAKGGVSRLDMARVFIALGVDAGGGGRLV